MHNGKRALLLLLLAGFCAGLAAAKPFTPADDAVVLERLPEKTDPVLAELKRLRAALAARPGDRAAAVTVARRSIEASRATGDPRFLGQAQAALSAWWGLPDPPADVLVLRATIKQSQHDFAGALADLDRLLAARPADAQALLTRATVLTVGGRYAEAQRDCGKLVRLTTPLVTITCIAGATSLSGDAANAYRNLLRALERPGEATGIRVWALTLAGEIAARRNDATAALLHFREAHALDPRDAYLKAVYADLLLDAGQPEAVVALLADDTRNDALLLRLALAEKALPAQAMTFREHREELSARFAAARRRGDALHLREEARFRLEIEGDAAAALAVAQRNWTTQREPADLRILAASARSARDAAALKTVADWLAATKLEDVAIASLAAGGVK